MNDEAWEKVCERCGRCCYEKVDFQGKIYYTQVPCEYLDLQTCLCKVYPDRARQRPGCVPLTPELVKRGYLPADCPYVADVEEYPEPVMDGEPESE